ncbi:MAG: hypothetical protein GEU83_00365 [Pseudonocardiaceae bacterium]|nr:hypothetical protein [Pseudonocardiaceae bacterium]
MNDPNGWAAPGQPPPDPPPPTGGNGPPPAGPSHGGPGWGGPGWVPPQQAPKPGVIPLRPLNLGEILDGAVSYIRANPAATLGLAAVVITLTQLIQVPAQYFLAADIAGLDTGPGTAPPSMQDFADTFAGSAPTAVISGLVGFVAITVLNGLLIVVLSRAVLGKRVGLSETWAAAGRRLPGLVGLSVLIVLIAFAVIAVAAVPAVVTGLTGAPVAVTVTLGILGFIAGVCLLVYLYVSLAMAAPVYMLEQPGVIAALSRSRTLVTPQWWRIFGILLLAAVIAGLINVTITIPTTFASVLADGPLLEADPVATPSLLSLVIAAVGAIIASTITAPFSAGVTGLLYVDQRIRREALDLELARAAGTPHPPAGGPPPYPGPPGPPPPPSW